MFEMGVKKAVSAVKVGKEISKTWISGASSCTLVIPKSIAEKKGLTEPSHVVVEDVPEGILIRKLTV